MLQLVSSRLSSQAAQKQSTSDAEKIARLGVHIVQTHEVQYCCQLSWTLLL